MGEKANTDQNISDIDKALAAAKARKAAKTGGDATATAAKPAKAAKEPAAPKEPKRPRLTDEEKAARIETRNQERATRKEARDAARAAKLAERIANKQPAHMRKVAKAAEKLPALSQALTLLLGEITVNNSAADLAAFASHLQHFNRVQSTTRATSQKLEAGQTVTIVGGDPRFIGKTGTVAKAQRIRCYVTVEGSKKDIYLFTSDVQATPAPAAIETTQEAAAS